MVVAGRCHSEARSAELGRSRVGGPALEGGALEWQDDRAAQPAHWSLPENAPSQPAAEGGWRQESWIFNAACARRATRAT